MELDKRARNLFVIAGAIIVYLFAGADLNQLAVLGLRAPARFPIVFSWAAVVALCWFWWRYNVVWLAACSRVNFGNEYLGDLHQLKPFKNYIDANINHDVITNTHFSGQRPAGDSALTLIRYSEVARKRRLLININVLTYTDGTTNFEIGTNDFPDKRPIEVRVPWWLHWMHSPFFFLQRAWRYDNFSNERLPHIVFAAAVALIACKIIGWDPAGLFGVFTDPTASHAHAAPLR